MALSVIRPQGMSYTPLNKAGDNATGIITKVAQPAFMVGFNGLDVPTSYVLPPSGGTVLYNIGGYFNTSTMRFTCPVAGMYIFFSGFLRSPTNAVVRGNYFKNGSAVNPQYRLTEAFTGYNDTASFVVPIQCAVNDVVDLRFISSPATSIYADGGTGTYNYFGGYLLG